MFDWIAGWVVYALIAAVMLYGIFKEYKVSNAFWKALGHCLVITLMFKAPYNWWGWFGALLGFGIFGL